MSGRVAALRPRGGLLAALAAVVAAAALVLAVTAFTAARSRPSTSHPTQGAPVRPPSAAASTPSVPKVGLSLAGLTHGVQPWSKPMRLRVSHGSMVAVKVTDNTGAVLDGTTSPTGWVSGGQLVPRRAYQLQAYVRGTDGVAAYHTLQVTTSAPDFTIGTSVSPLDGRTVGVGFAITVEFTKPVTDRAAAERALVVRSSPAVVGAWHWFSPTVVHYRPQTYWPAHTTVTLHSYLTGVQLAPGGWGSTDRDISFTIGDAHVSTVDVATQRMKVTVNGAVKAVYKVSTGRAQYPTLGGVHVVLDKRPSYQMRSDTVGIPKFITGPDGKQAKNPDFYDEKVLWDVRISNGGAFVHYAPWSRKSQGVAPVSHGCVNVDLGPATAFFNLSQVGDVVDIVNDPIPPKLEDPGMIDWNLTWPQWLAGSSTGA